MRESATPVGMADVLRARRRLHGIARVTPLEHSTWLSERAGCDVYLKLECRQRTGSFKLRGAYNAVAALDAEARGRGLVAASAGNHGQGLALASRSHHARCTVFVPADAPAAKKARIRALGAELREAASYDAAEAEAIRFGEATGAAFIHPCSDPAVIAGQGTVGLEIAETLPDVAHALVPVGGGGLVTGIGIALAALTGGNAVVTGVQTKSACVMHDSLAAGRVLEPPPHETTLADGLAGGIDATGLENVRATVDGIALVDDAEVASAIRELYRHHGVVTEGAGAVTVAAVASGRVRPRGPVALVLSGGNIDGDRLARILQGEDWQRHEDHNADRRT